MVGDDLHEPVIHQHEAKLFGNDIRRQQQRTAKKGGGDKALAEGRHGAP